MEFPKNVSVYKDDKRYICTLELAAVSGGTQVIYIADDGTIMKREPLYRYNERLKRRKEGSVGYAIKV